MSRLFSAPKVLVTCDTYSPGMEKRRGDEVGILTLTLRVQPFDAQLAVALDDGVGGDSNIRSTVFSHTTTDPRPHFTRHDFKLGLPRQLLTLYASRDTVESRIAIDQAKVSGTYVRMKDDELGFVFKVSFGPVSKEELEYIHAWHRGQRAVTFEASENPLDFEEDDEDEDDDPFPPVDPRMFDGGDRGPVEVEIIPPRRGKARHA